MSGSLSTARITSNQQILKQHIDVPTQADRTRLFCAAALIPLLLCYATTSQAEVGNATNELDRNEQRIFARYTRLFVAQFFHYEDRFVILPNHKRQRENSNGRSVDQAKEEMTVTRREYRDTVLGRQLMDIKYPPSAAKVYQSAKALPRMDVGHYGHIKTVRVLEILGPEEMIVERINGKQAPRRRYPDQEYDETYRLLGFNTEQLATGQTYKGPKNSGLHIAVMSTDPICEFVLVNFDQLKRVKTHEFVDALDYVDLSPKDFIDLVRANRESLKTEGDKASLISIYYRFYNRYRPRKLSESPALNPEAEQELEPEPNVPKADDEGEGEAEGQKKEGSDEAEDDWEYEPEEDENAPADGPSFFGIPL